MQVQNQGTEGCVVRIRERIDQSVHGVSTHCIVIDPSSVNEFVVEVSSKERIWKLPEKLLQQTCNTIDVVLKCFRISEVYLRCVCS